MIPALLNALSARPLFHWWPLAALAVLVLTLAPHIPIGGDFYWFYYRVPQDWLAGQTRLYDDASRGYFLPPWGIWPYLPLSLLDAFLANALANTIAALIIGGIAYRQSGSPLIALLSASCPYSLVLYLTGTPDAWSLLGLWVAWRASHWGNGWGLGVGAALALVRPQNCLLTLPALFRGGRPVLLQAGGVLALVLVASAVVSGPEWPLRWWENYFIRPPSPEGAATTYSAFQRIGVPLWASGIVGLAAAVYVFRRWGSLGNFEFLMALNAVLTPFVRSPSYVLLLAIPWAGLAIRRPWLAAGVYGISLPTIMVPAFWDSLAPMWPYVPYFDLLFPVGLATALLLERRRAVSSRVLQPATA